MRSRRRGPQGQRRGPVKGRENRGHSQKPFTRRAMAKRFAYIIVGMLAAIFFLCCFVIKYHIFEHSKLVKLNQSQTTEVVTLQSARGTIFDRNGRPLAESVLTNSLYADPNMINKSPEEIAKIIAPFVQMKIPNIIAALSDKETSFVWINRMMDHDKYVALRTVLRENDIHGLDFIAENKRYYPNGDLLAQTLGFVGTDDKGLDGLEMVYDKDIRGNEMKKLIMRDRKGNPILKSVMTSLIPVKQRSLKLTIDTTVQYICEKALNHVMKETKASGASIIIMDPKTGEILAMANRPTFSPAHFEKASEEDFKNRAVTNIYEPGSTFKPIVASAALSTGKWTLDTVYHDDGYVRANGQTIRNWDDVAHGDVKLEEILKFSYNTGMAHIGLVTGAHDLLRYIKAFGFGKETGIELPGEGSGILFNEKNILPIETATMSIGQGIAVTPLQMVQAFGALANGGKMMRPHLVKEIDNPDGSVYKAEKIEQVGTPIKQKIAKEITNILEEETESGGGIKARVAGYQFAGKTGTAQKIDPVHGGYLPGRYIASFIGYGPLPNPKFVMLVVIDDPEGTYYGGQIAAPVFQEVMTQLVRYFHISPTRIDAEAKTSMIKWEPPKVTKTSDGAVVLPSFNGWTIARVQDWLQKAGLYFRPHGSGFGYSQRPAGGNALKEGNVVDVYFKE